MEKATGFENSVVVMVSAGYYRANKSIPKHRLEAIVKKNPYAAKWLTGSRKIINPVEIKKMGKLYNKLTAYLNPKDPASPCLPNSIPGCKTISLDDMLKVDAELTELQTEFMGENGAERFCRNFEDFKKEAQENLELDGLWSELDYPVDIRSKFKFSWKFLQVETPGKISSLSPEIYERERKKLEADMEATRQECIDALRHTMMDMVSHIVERFSNGGKQVKVYRDTTVENFYDFFENFKTRNIFKDDALTEIVGKVQGILKNRPAGIFRENDSIKKQVRGQLKKVQNEMDEIFEKPRRKIKMD